MHFNPDNEIQLVVYVHEVFGRRKRHAEISSYASVKNVTLYQLETFRKKAIQLSQKFEFENFYLVKGKLISEDTAEITSTEKIEPRQGQDHYFLH